MRILRQEDYKVMPWKNGGGLTTEIEVAPRGAGLSGEPFDWRVSIADVTADGPFSRFPGYDRHIMLLEGQGMRLETEDSGVIILSRHVPAAFSGDWPITGKLVGGPVRDFNLMVARSFGHGTLACQKLTTPLSLIGDGSIRLIFAIDGEMSLGGHIIAQGETVILGETESAVLSFLDSGAVFALCAIHHHGQGSRM